jgi:hypothetical protein
MTPSYSIISYIKLFDTLNKDLVMSLEIVLYDPFIAESPTHYKNIKGNHIVFFRFDSCLDIKVIRKLNFKPITIAKANYFRKLGNKIAEQSGMHSGSHSAMVFTLKGNAIQESWYEDANNVPDEYKTQDKSYFGRNVKFEIYLQRKLFEYGYR